MTDELSLHDLPQPEWEGTVSPDDLHVDGENPNEQSDELFGLLCENMRRKGWIGNAIVTDTDGLIADGEHRWRAAQEIGLDEVPVKQYELSEADRRLWRQELNKISGEHDVTRDALEYDYLLDNGKMDDVQALTNAVGEDLDELLAEIKLTNEQRVPYKYDPEHNVYFEDCVEGMRERVDDDSVDCVITDPPYGIDVDLSDTLGTTETVEHIGTVENDGYEEAIDLFTVLAEQLDRVCSSDAHLYVFASWKTYDDFRDILLQHGFCLRNCLVWSKSNVNNQAYHGSGGVYYGTRHEFILYATRDSTKSLERLMPDVLPYTLSTQGLEHPTQKPVDLVEDLLTNSTSHGDTVCDPFMGSGTTAVAAIQNNRDYVGFEFDEENYRTVIKRRISEAKRQVETPQNTPAGSD